MEYILWRSLNNVGSGKSHFIVQKLILKALKYKGVRFLFCRRYGSTLLNSVMKETKLVLQEFGIYDYCKISDYNREYILPNGSSIIFMGLDDENKLLSLSDISTIFVEEVYEVEEEKFDQLNLRLRSNKCPMEIYCAFNPISKTSWLYERMYGEDTNKLFDMSKTFILKTTFKDNKYLPKDYIDSLKDLERTNYKKYWVFSLGNFGSNEDGLIYKNVIYKDFIENEIIQIPNIDIRIGLDFGYVDPNAIGIFAFNHKEKKCYVLKESYKSGLTLDQIYNELVNMRIANTRNKFYCDSADARGTQFLRNKGVRVEGVKKVKISEGISFLQNYQVIVPSWCPNFRAEIENYSYKKNIKTGKYEEDKYDGNDHLMDCWRYSASDLYNNRTITSAAKFRGL